MPLYLGVDDTDSLRGMCTTFLATELVRDLREWDLIGYPRLVRLNPNIPWKTRGNGAICLRLGAGRGRRIRRRTGIHFTVRRPGMGRQAAAKAAPTGYRGGVRGRSRVPLFQVQDGRLPDERRARAWPRRTASGGPFAADSADRGRGSHRRGLRAECRALIAAALTRRRTTISSRCHGSLGALHRNEFEWVARQGRVLVWISSPAADGGRAPPCGRCAR